MFETICDSIPSDGDYSLRTRSLDILRRVLNGTLYDVLPYHFHQERSGGGEYIPLRNRRPSVRYALCRVVVEDSVSLLFSEGHFPTIDCPDRSVSTFLANIAKETRLNQIMIDAAIRGSIGSVPFFCVFFAVACFWMPWILCISHRYGMPKRPIR